MADFMPDGKDAKALTSAVKDIVGSTQSSQNVMLAGGDTDVLRSIIEEMQKTTTPEGMEEVMKAIFSQGFEKELPKILSKANSAGIRPQDATTQQLLEQDLATRLSSQVALLLGQQQANTANAAANLGELTKKPTVTNLETKDEGIVGQIAGWFS